MNSAKQLGHTGEKLVQDYLVRRGFEIVATNYHAQGGEIDIIARQGDDLRFVEVKSRTNKTSRVGEAVEALHSLKHKRLEKAMYAFLETYTDDVENYSLDVAIVEVRTTKARITYYPNALEALYEA